MGTQYTSGVVNHVPLDELYPDGVESDEAAVAWLLRFAALGLSRRFREIIGTRVAEFVHDGETVTWRWLSEDEDKDEAAAVLAGAFDEPTHDDGWPGAMDVDLVVPNCTTADHGNVDAPDLAVNGWWFSPMDQVVAGVAASDADEYFEVDQHLVEALRFCERHHVIFAVG